MKGTLRIASVGLCLILAAVVARAQPELSLPRLGPFSLKGSRIWQVGPFWGGGGHPDTFTVPADLPFGNVMVLTGLNCELYKIIEGQEVLLMSHLTSPRPRPGFILPPGEYKVDLNTGGSINLLFVWGYLAPRPGAAYSGSDEYPDQGKIWQFHPALAGTTEFSVPPGRVYMLTYMAKDTQIDRFVGGQWVTYFSSANENSLRMPGIRLSPGRYRMGGTPLGPHYCGGYITTQF